MTLERGLSKSPLRFASSVYTLDGDHKRKVERTPQAHWPTCSCQCSPSNQHPSTWKRKLGPDSRCPRRAFPKLDSMLCAPGMLGPAGQHLFFRCLGLSSILPAWSLSFSLSLYPMSLRGIAASLSTDIIHVTFTFHFFVSHHAATSWIEYQYYRRLYKEILELGCGGACL